MIDRVLIDTLELKSRDFAIRWKDALCDNPQFGNYNKMDEKSLIEMNMKMYPLLSRSLDRGFDHAQIEHIFVKLGKDRMHSGFSISEVILALNLVQKIVIEYIMTEFAPENPVRMYQSMGALTKLSEFFLMGSFYIFRGFLEEIYTSMNIKDKISEDLLKKYFRDDFFFKQG